MVMLVNPASRSQERFTRLVRLLWGDITQDGLAATRTLCPNWKQRRQNARRQSTKFSVKWVLAGRR